MSLVEVVVSRTTSICFIPLQRWSLYIHFSDTRFLCIASLGDWSFGLMVALGDMMKRVPYGVLA